jgi:lipoprotein Spr
MRLKLYIIVIFLTSAFASCKSVQNIAHRDKSGSETVNRKNATEKREFINGIQVTLGTVITTKQKTSSISSSPSKTNQSNATSDIPIISGESERAYTLQLKYSPIINVPIDNLNNIILLEQIDKWWGTRYCIGGSSENCVDCSGFTQIIMRNVFNLSIVRTAQEQHNQAQRIEREDLQEGDLVFFGKSVRSISHVGIYLQNNKFVHASTSNGVMVSDLNDKYWNPKYRGGGRVNNN